jgi:hypothetical protein
MVLPMKKTTPSACAGREAPPIEQSACYIDGSTFQSTYETENPSFERQPEA